VEDITHAIPRSDSLDGGIYNVRPGLVGGAGAISIRGTRPCDTGTPAGPSDSDDGHGTASAIVSCGASCSAGATRAAISRVALDFIVRNERATRQFDAARRPGIRLLRLEHSLQR
jgi:hypothetical protein